MTELVTATMPTPSTVAPTSAARGDREAGWLKVEKTRDEAFEANGPTHRARQFLGRHVIDLLDVGAPIRAPRVQRPSFFGSTLEVGP